MQRFKRAPTFSKQEKRQNHPEKSQKVGAFLMKTRSISLRSKKCKLVDDGIWTIQTVALCTENVACHQRSIFFSLNFTIVSPSKVHKKSRPKLFTFTEIWIHRYLPRLNWRKWFENWRKKQAENTVESKSSFLPGNFEKIGWQSTINDHIRCEISIKFSSRKRVIFQSKISRLWWASWFQISLHLTQFCRIFLRQKRQQESKHFLRCNVLMPINCTPNSQFELHNAIRVSYAAPASAPPRVFVYSLSDILLYGIA